MARWFGNDKDGFDLVDFEKLLTGICFFATVMVVLVKYVISDRVSTDMIYLVGLLGSLFVIRKGLSYLKPDRYYEHLEEGNDDKEEG